MHIDSVLEALGNSVESAEQRGGENARGEGKTYKGPCRIDGRFKWSSYRTHQWRTVFVKWETENDWVVTEIHSLTRRPRFQANISWTYLWGILSPFYCLWKPALKQRPLFHLDGCVPSIIMRQYASVIAPPNVNCNFYSIVVQFLMKLIICNQGNKSKVVPLTAALRLIWK